MCACVGIVAIACDTVRRDRGCSGADVNGVAVGFVLLADTFDDPENARIILLSAAGLVLLGLLSPSAPCGGGAAARSSTRRWARWK